MKRKKNEEYKKSQIRTINIFDFNFCIKVMFCLKVQFEKKAVYPITFYLQFLCVAGFLKQQ